MGQNIEEARHHALAAWKQTLESKKDEARQNLTECFHIALQKYLDNLLALKKFIKSICTMCDIDSTKQAHEMFQALIDEAKQSLDMQDELQQQGSQSIGTDEGKHYTNFNTLNLYLQSLKNSKALSKITKILGRAKEAKKQGQGSGQAGMQEAHSKRYKEELQGVTLGRDLENLLPQELALLGDSDLELLFDLKYIQNRLFCFEKQALSTIDTPKRASNQGAMIICIDTSSSMEGQPEYIAKALALYLATQAQTQERACYLINFSTNIETMELSDKGGLARLMSFVSMSFYGGTDVSPALQAGVQKMQSEAFKKSDLIVISDGGFGSISSTLEKQMQAQRAKKNKFYLLDINGSSGAKKFFDIHWLYSTRSDNTRVLYRSGNGRN